MKKKVTFLICLLMPPFIKPFFLNLIGHQIDKSARIGFAIIYSDDLKMGNNSRIKSFNLIYITSIEMNGLSIIGSLNIINGAFKLILHERAAIGKQNKIGRGPSGVTYGTALLELGILTKITAKHHIDVTRSIKFGNYSILAGISSQLWTHGYVHSKTGADRFRVDGEINIGNNVYIGSGVLINPGVRIADTINIGGNSTISKDLILPGMYVTQPLRHLDKSYENIKASLNKVEAEGLIEDVYEK